MAAIEFKKESISALKAELLEHFPEVRSSHLTESIAAALGYRTHAALLADIDRYMTDDPPFRLIESKRFVDRLKELGNACYSCFDYEHLGIPAVISTVPNSADKIAYRSNRTRAWRNLIVAAINVGLEKQLFSLRPGDNRWPGAIPDKDSERSKGHVYSFTLPNGLPAKGYVSDAGYDELTIHAAVNPQDDTVQCSNGGFDAGDAFAAAWLERSTGVWIQSATDLFNCRRSLIPVLAALEVEPAGYGDRGRVIC